MCCTILVSNYDIMLDITITLDLYEKVHINALIEIIKKCSIEAPVYIVEMSDSFQIEFASTYHHWELQDYIEQLFDDYHFTENIGKNYSDMVLKIHRTQSPFSTGKLGERFNEDPVNTTHFLVRNNPERKDITPNTTFRVLFGNDMNEYNVHLASGVYKSTNEPFYAVLKEAFTNPEDAQRLSDKNFPTPIQAFWEGYRLMRNVVDEDYQSYLKRQKSIRRKRRKPS